MMIKWRWLPLSLSVAAALSACAHDPPVRPAQAHTGPQAAGAPHADGRRGIIECREDEACGSPAAPDVPGTLVPVRADDVNIRFLRVGADGQQRVLENGSALPPGAAFTILIQARRDANLYLWHADPQGRLVELVGASGALGARDCARANRLRAGQTVQLPAAGAHYTLDRRAGAERIYPVLSAAPLCGANGTAVGGWLRAGTGPDCSGRAGTCGEVFVINRLTRT